MKIDVTFTHWGFWYGLPVYLSYENAGVFPLPMIPLTGWWIKHVAEFIHMLRQIVIAAFDIDTPERGHYVVFWQRKLRTPKVKTFDWSEEVIREYQKS